MKHMQFNPPLVILTGVLCSVLSKQALAETATIDGVTWTYSYARAYYVGERLLFSDGVIIGQSSTRPAIPRATEGHVTIPSTIDGHPVKMIQDYAFYMCSGITSATIPDSVEIIGSYAFSGCSGLTSITIPNKVTRIESDSFSGCSGLTSITIPDGVTSIGVEAFYRCDKLFDTDSFPGLKLIDGWVVGYTSSISEHLDLTGVRGIADYAFDECYRLKSVLIPNGMTRIAEQAFRGCSRLTSITIPESVTSIGFNSFYGSGITNCLYNPSATILLYVPPSVSGSFDIPNTVMSIGDHAFVGCSKLTSINIPDCVTNIGNFTFYECSGLKSFTIPNGVTSIGLRTLYGCSGLTSIAIPDNVTSFEFGAFEYCTGITSITIPNSVTNIGDSAFYGCSGIASVTADPKWGMQFCSATNMVFTIPDGVTSIPHWAFQQCSGLTSITIPNSVTNIGYGAFWLCSGLPSIAIPNSVESIDNYVFDSCSQLKKVYLPRRFQGNTQGFSLPSNCETVFYDALYYLSTDSPVGHPIPNGRHIPYASNEIVSCSVEHPASSAGTNPVRLVCSGWRGTGSVPASGTGTNVTFTITEDSSITWLWETNAWLDCSLIIDGRETNIVDWIPVSDSPFDIPVDLRSEILIVALSGDTNGVVVNAASGTISIPGDGPRTVSIRIESITDTRSVETEGKPIAFTESIGSGWLPVADASAADGFCLRSGEIEAGETSTTETTLVGPGTLSFKWKVPAGRGDYARAYLDDVERTNINRKTEWQLASLDIPAGEHVVRWNYERGTGSATGEDAAFLDDVDWRPQVALEVASAYGTASPAPGTHTLVYGDEVAAGVIAPEATDGVRRVCTGWTGTGSVPEGGTDTSASFVITNDSSIVWNWRTDYWTEVSVSGGAVDFEPQWVAAGSAVSVALSPATHLYEISLSGDTSDVTLDGTTLRFAADGPRRISVTITEVKVSLTVESAHGVPSPTNGVHALSWGTEVAANVAEPEPADGIQYRCIGWTGTGGVPASGAGTNVTFTIEADSSISWNWTTNVWIALAASGPVSADFAEEWIEQGSNVVVHWAPTADYFTIALTGDADGAVLDEEARTIEIPADRPRSVTFAAKELTLAGALDGQGLRWTTGGAAAWFPQVAVTHDGEDAARSGSVLGDETSALEVALEGPGTFAWSWRIDAAGNAGVDVLLDGEWIENIAPGAEWTRETLAITDDGRHAVRFEFWNEGTTATLDDCAYLDEVSWTGETPGGRTTLESEVPVPFAWLDGYALVADGDYEAAAVAMAANGVNRVWQCYVAGLDPNSPTNRFLAEIVFDESGEPRIGWTPDLGSARDYVVEGKASLTNGWSAVGDDSRFFRVKVRMPE